MMMIGSRRFSFTSTIGWWTLAVSSIVVIVPPSSHPNSLFAAADSGCTNALALATTRMQATACGQLYPFTCPICEGNYDGEGAEVASCGMENEICLNEVCGEIVTSGGWKAGAGVQSQSTLVTLTRGLTGKISLSLTTSVYIGNTCDVKVNDVSCGTCVMVQCSEGDQTRMVQADCSNLGQGVLNFCDQENFGSPGDLLSFIFLPAKCAKEESSAGTSPQPAPTPLATTEESSAGTSPQSAPTPLATTEESSAGTSPQPAPTPLATTPVKSAVAPIKSSLGFLLLSFGAVLYLGFSDEL